VISARRGVTLIELLVAMALAGLVATFVVGWIVHAAKMSHASQVRDDRDQSLALVRKSLFEDGTRGNVLQVSSESWMLERSRGNSPPDTVRWSVAGNFPRTPSWIRGSSRRFPARTWKGIPGANAT